METRELRLWRSSESAKFPEVSRNGSRLGIEWCVVDLAATPVPTKKNSVIK